MYPVRKIPGKEHLGALTSIVDDAEATVSARLTTVLVDSYSFPYASPFARFCMLDVHLFPFVRFCASDAWPGFIWPCFSSVRKRAFFSACPVFLLSSSFSASSKPFHFDEHRS